MTTNRRRSKKRGRVVQSVEPPPFKRRNASSTRVAPTILGTTAPAEPGFSIRVNEVEAREIITGVLPETVREQFRQMMADYDAHLASCQAALDSRR